MYSVALKNVVRETSNIFTYYFEKPLGFTWTPGTHVHLAFPAFKDSQGNIHKEFVRHFSISNLETEGLIGITTRLDGDGSLYKRLLKDISIGDALILFKPVNDMPLIRDGSDLTFITMGVGAATIKPLIEAYQVSPEGVSLFRHFNICKAGEDLYEPLRLKTQGLLEWKAFNEKEAFKNALLDLPSNKGYFYVVGSDGFLESMIALLKTKGIGKDQIIIDKKEIIKPTFLK